MASALVVMQYTRMPPMVINSAEKTAAKPFTRYTRRVEDGPVPRVAHSNLVPSLNLILAVEQPRMFSL